MELNEQQARVAEDPFAPLFVAAGAGSGKTRALASRYANAIVGLGERAAEHAVAITFTEKAAGELVERIRAVLLDKGRDPVAARSVDAGWVSTIHGFAARLLRGHPVEAGIDPRVNVGSELDMSLLRAEVFSRLVEERKAHDPQVAALVEAFGLERVRDSVFGAASLLAATRSTVDDLRADTAGADADALHERLATIASRLRDLASEAGQMDGSTAQEVAGSALAVSEALSEVPADADDEALFAAVAAIQPASFSKRGAVGDLARLAVEMRDEALSALAERLLLPLRSGLLDLIEAFIEEYDAAKSRLHVLDFDDLTTKAYQLVSENPRVAERYQERFRSFMVDEFQDTDWLQSALVEALGGRTLCTVGDEQQSIYGWRSADVELFRSRREECDDKLVELTLNYRSRPEVLEFINGVFGTEALFGGSFLRLEPTREPSQGAAPPVEVLLIDKEACEEREWYEVEAEHVADKVATFLARGHRPGDIALLFRRMSYSSHFVRALRDRGVPVSSAGSVRPWDVREVQTVLQGLCAVANPLDEEALVGFLAGPLSGVGEAVLARVAALSKEKERSLWASAVELAREGVSDELSHAVETLASLRAQRGAASLQDLVADLLHRTGYLGRLRCDDTGREALEGLEALLKVAEDLDGSGVRCVQALVDHVREREERLPKDEPLVPHASGDAVRVMTIHSAKGLEFPVVFVPDCGRGPSRSGLHILLHRERGRPRLAMRLPKDRGRGIKAVGTRAHQRAQEALFEAEVAEEKRLLYVACTRARDALVVSAVHDLRADDRETPASWLIRALDLKGVDSDETERFGARITLVRRSEGEDSSRCEEKADLPAASQGDDSPGSGPLLLRLASGAGRVHTREAPAPRTLSYTALREFLDCPLKFHLRRELGMVEPPVKPSDAVSLGVEAHALLARLAAEAPLGEADEAVDAASRVADLPSTPQGEEAVRVVSALLARPAVSEALRMQDVLPELPFCLRLGDVDLVGKIDLLGREGGRAVVVDYKTGPLADSEEARERERLQAVCYAAAVLESGVESATVVFVHPEGESLRLEFSSDQTEGLKDEIASVLERIGSGSRPARSARDRRVCSDCPARRGLCPTGASGDS